MSTNDGGRLITKAKADKYMNNNHQKCQLSLCENGGTLHVRVSVMCVSVKGDSHFNKKGKGQTLQLEKKT